MHQILRGLERRARIEIPERAFHVAAAELGALHRARVDDGAGSRAAVVTTSSEFRTGTLSSSNVRQLTDIQLTEIENRMMHNQLMERFARELYQRVMEMF